ncbi:MAG: hypothetical protein MUE34_00555 [Acidimicrobiales bacterium]|nr:hypothetical protein [Acidimicrobiales bacterium]
MGGGAQDEIRLDLPASGPYARIARVAASSLALRLRVPARRIEDLRLAVDEALVLLLSVSRGEEDTIHGRYLVSDRSLAVELRLEAPVRPIGTAAVERFGTLVEPLDTRCRVDVPTATVLVELTAQDD